ncbi:peptidase inhibitor family I36 protein [Actinoplanes sp. TRM 88003]|uniref:Peptidase inhibitor family I36 protein n=1 Tax=Paractinoplanes aksuensis TaxID=2939490 RepID=A0ABT1DVL0_9ACTN|nr:peptidase inhibitor family I36 protein [Actinoplanes aksuensis]MCO8274899.1 peptidase inhibitor family I36 protein [Actinoplanes aksuensis]
MFSILAAGAVVMLGSVVGATPAQAVTACPNNYFCLYRWINWEAGRWQIPNNGTNWDRCWNLSNSTYTDGYNVDQTSASVINNTNLGDRPINISLYTGQNCTGASSSNRPETAFRTGSYRQIANLNDVGYYHAFRSIRFERA